MQKLFLVFFFTFALFADMGEEIGKPVVDLRNGFIDSAVLSSDGKSFYTLQDQDLIHRNLSPLKKLEAWKVPLPGLTVGKEINQFHNIYLLENETKVLITCMERSLIYDLQNHKVEKDVQYGSYSIVKDGDLLYLTHLTPYGVSYAYNVDLEVWQLPALKHIRTVNLTMMTEQNSSEPNFYKGNLLVGHDVIFYFGSFDVLHMVILDKKSFKIKEVQYGDNQVEVTHEGYVDQGNFIYRLSDGEQVERGRSYGHNWAKEHNKTVVDGFSFSFRPRRSSCVENLCLRAAKNGSRLPYIFLKLTDLESSDAWGSAFIAQSHGELVVQNHKSRYFETSSYPFDLLNMLTADNKVVPMNEATFKKYNQPLKIGTE